MHRINKPSILHLLIGVIGLFPNLVASAQNASTSYTPNIIPASPNAASLAKFGDIPVSPYTGTSDISIPIYSIQAKGVSVPVTLAYHTGGIRLAEEAGWVGLGWALNAGGMISRTINNNDDFINGSYFNSQMTTPMPEIKGKLVSHPQYTNMTNMGVWGYDFYCRYNVYTEAGIVNLFNVAPNIFNGLVDLEPDSYSFNFLGRSGKFIIGRDGKVVLQKQEKLKIQFAIDASSFTITDELGNNYYFQDKEYSQPTTGGAQHVSAWLLSKIVTQEKDSVKFNYYSDGTWSNVVGVNQETLRIGIAGYESPIYSNDPGQSYLNKTLQSIDYTNAQIKFSFSGSRSDLQNGKRLDTISIYSKDQNGKLIYLKEHQLYYSYFNPALKGGSEFLRLRLDSVREASGGISLPAYTFGYNMALSESNMGKHYSSVDHWGFYNGVFNGVSGNPALGFVPGFVGIVSIGSPVSMTTQYLSLTGANRETGFDYMIGFSLNKITYPTGGYSLFDYEANDYDYYNSKIRESGTDFEYVTVQSQTPQVRATGNGTFSGTVDFSDIYLTSGSISNGNLTVAFRAAGSDSLNYYHNNLPYGNINFTFQNNITDITNASLQCSGMVTGNNCSGTVYSLAMPIAISTAGPYSWSAYIDPKVSKTGFMDITATFTYLSPAYRHTTLLTAGGLRVKMIRDYSANGQLAKKRTYEYTYQQDRDGKGLKTYSYGKLMGELCYARQEPIEVSYSRDGGITTQWGMGISLTRYSSAITSFTSQSSGNTVGYDQVTEYTIDSASGADNGKTVYTYYNSPDTAAVYGGYRFPGVLSLPNNLNGLPKSKSVFARSGTGYSKISSADYYYHSANRIIYSAFKWMHADNDPLSSTGGVNTSCTSASGCSCPLNIDSASFHAISNFYPVISSEVVLLDSTIEKTFDQNDATKQLMTVTRNFYDNPAHYQMTRSKINDSKSNTHVSFIRYPQDYIPNGSTLTGNTILDSMINKNMVASAVEKQDSFYYAGSSSGYIRGSQLNAYKVLLSGSVALDKQYKLDLSSPVNDFAAYAVSGNTTSQDSRYRQMISYDSYDNTNNINQYTGTDQLPVAFLWDYKNLYPVAQVKKASQSDIAYTSFEADGTGGWSGINSGYIQSTGGITGNKYYSATGFSISRSPLTAANYYTVSYWSNSGAYSIMGTVSGYPITYNSLTRSGNTWTYYEHLVTGQATITVTGSGGIDELRLYPKGALMNTYTYTPLMGMTSQCDATNRISFYDYDPFGRLFVIKDQNSNILKKYCYNYNGQAEYCSIYGNSVQSGTYNRNNCSPGYGGSAATYTVAANTYYSFTQSSANVMAQNDVAANGQNYANANGTCIAVATITGSNSQTISYTVSFTRSSDNTVVYRFSLPVGASNSTLGQIPLDTYNVQFQPNGFPPSANFSIGPYSMTNVTGASFSNVSITTTTLASVY